MWTRLVPATAMAIVMSQASPVSADDREATCARLRAESEAEALPLYGPRLQVEAARIPNVVQAQDPSAVATDGYQGRVAIAFSPVDALRGRAIERIADADCTRERVSGAVADVLAAGTQIGALEATRAELAYLDEHLAQVDEVVADVAERFAAQRATAMELDDVRGRRSAIVLRISELRTELASLEALELEPAAADALDRLAAEYRAASLAVEERRGELRALAPWRIELKGGVAASDGADWFGVVEVSYSFGGLFQGRANARARQARARELDTDDREVGIRLQRVRTVMRRSVEALAPAIAALSNEVENLRSERDRVRALDSDSARHLLARLTLDLVVLEARLAATSSLLAARRPYAGATP